MRPPLTLKFLCLAAMSSSKVNAERVSRPQTEVDLAEQARSPPQIHPSLRRPLAADKAVRLYPVFREYEMEEEQGRCLAAMVEELTTRDIGKHDLKAAATFHRACVEVACTFNESELYSACVDVAIDHPATHFDALILNLGRTRERDLQVLASKLKRSAYEHRNQFPFVLRFFRPYKAFCSPEACVEYVHLANGGRVPFGF